MDALNGCGVVLDLGYAEVRGDVVQWYDAADRWKDLWRVAVYLTVWDLDAGGYQAVFRRWI